MYYKEGGEALAQVTQRGGQCLSLETFKARLGRSLNNLV